MKLTRSISKTERDEIARPNVDIFDGDIIKILDEGKWVTFRFRGQERKRLVFKIQTKLMQEKLLPLNQISINNLIDAYGEETKEWIGKEARVWIFKTQVGGQFKDVVYLTHPDWIFENGKFLPSHEKTKPKSKS
jgi:hypothetical protein